MPDSARIRRLVNRDDYCNRCSRAIRYDNSCHRRYSPSLSASAAGAPIDELRPPTTDWAVRRLQRCDGTATDIYRASPIHVLLPVAIFVISLLTIEFSRHSNLIATIWPSNAIILAALLRYARSPINYALLSRGWLCGKRPGRFGWPAIRPLFRDTLVRGEYCRDRHRTGACWTMFRIDAIQSDVF